jgi:hypothetical protein
MFVANRVAVHDGRFAARRTPLSSFRQLLLRCILVSTIIGEIRSSSSDDAWRSGRAASVVSRRRIRPCWHAVTNLLFTGYMRTGDTHRQV